MPKKTVPEGASAAPAQAGPRRNLYDYIGEAWHHQGSPEMRQLTFQRHIEWRVEKNFSRIEHPTRLDRARALGYKAKPGIIVVRAGVRRGGLRKHRIRKGRRPKRKGIAKITMKKSLQRIAEERASKHYPNLEVLNSYWVGEDGRHKWYEIILVDPHHPAILSDAQLGWIAGPAHRGRANRGLTSAGKRGRGLRWKGFGAEKNRPSLRAHDRQGN